MASLAGPDDQNKLIELLAVTENNEYIADIQTALANAAGKISDPERRSAKLLQAMSGSVKKEKIIPVLSKTGGREALAVVLKEFENGNADTRDICFSALTNWVGYSASSALYQICASGNKTFEAPAFDGYIRQIADADLPDDQKLLLYRKIMPFALVQKEKQSSEWDW
ncbi:MAG: hypothetical protein IPJ37_11855 [Bacteroidales bacterium]|nr:hypothetical protein [Bacteroidales bacterium]